MHKNLLPNVFTMQKLFSEYEYVDKEEHDAKLLFSGKLLKEYHVNKDTGEIEEIQ